jgi:hypothetical protein
MVMVRDGVASSANAALREAALAAAPELIRRLLETTP